MAGHSKFKNIMHRKGAQDRKRAKIFNKLGREITVATKMGGGDDPDMNARLRNAIAAAKAENMPNDRIDRAIKSGMGSTDGENYDDMRYEGYGPGGIAIVIEALTDNRNRTASELRTTFAKNGGNLGETGSVSFMFDQVGYIAYPTSIGDFDTVFEAAVEAGAENLEKEDNVFEMTTAMTDFAAVNDALAKKYGDPQEARLIWKPQNTVVPSDDHADTLMKLIEALDDLDDTQNVFTNADLDAYLAAQEAA